MTNPHTVFKYFLVPRIQNVLLILVVYVGTGELVVQLKSQSQVSGVGYANAHWNTIDLDKIVQCFESLINAVKDLQFT